MFWRRQNLALWSYDSIFSRAFMILLLLWFQWRWSESMADGILPLIFWLLWVIFFSSCCIAVLGFCTSLQSYLYDSICRCKLTLLELVICIRVLARMFNNSVLPFCLWQTMWTWALLAENITECAALASSIPVLCSPIDNLFRLKSWFHSFVCPNYLIVVFRWLWYYQDHAWWTLSKPWLVAAEILIVHYSIIDL